MLIFARPMRRAPVVATALVAMLLALLLTTPQGRDGASRLLAQFRSDRSADAALSTRQIADIEQLLTELRPLGVVAGLDTMPDPLPVATVAAASEAVGFPVLAPDATTLSAGIAATPGELRVIPAHQLRFTLDVERARAHYAALGHDDVSLPERFDRAALVIDTPPAVLLRYAHADAAAATPFGLGLLLGQAGTVTVSAEGGVTLDELQEFLAELPGFSSETVQQLWSLDDWQTTLPLPIPLDEIAWERATIAGSPGLLLNDNTGLGSAALWKRDGRVFGIAGAMKAEELRRVAESLR